MFFLALNSPFRIRLLRLVCLVFVILGGLYDPILSREVFTIMLYLLYFEVKNKKYFKLIRASKYEVLMYESAGY